VSGFKLKSYEFRRERESKWQELEGLVSRIERHGLSSLNDEEIARLPGLYRAALSSLSVARSISLDKDLVSYLEVLAQRAYLCVYSTRRSLWTTVRQFFERTFPGLVYDMRRFLLVSAVLLVAGVAAGTLLTLENPDRFYSFVDDNMAGGRGPLSTREELSDVLRGDGRGLLGMLSAFASFLFTHNARIGLLCFALGFAFGLPVLLLLFTNGLLLGAFSAIYIRQDLAIEFWAWVLPHGITELLAACICGAAGLSVGYSIIFPGRYRRLDQLVHRGREAALVVVGAVAMFFVAALVEGFFRQLVHSVPIRLSLAAISMPVWLLYFRRAGRRLPT
jgi:uncharacterized membrane protein SpoIIM required for sporulation